MICGICHFDTALLLLTDYFESHLSSAVPDVSSTYVLCVHSADIVNTFDSGHPDVLVLLQQIKGASNTSTFIKNNWLHVLTLIG